MRKTTWQCILTHGSVFLASVFLLTSIAVAQDNQGDTPRKRRQERAARESTGEEKSPVEESDARPGRLRAQGSPFQGSPGAGQMLGPAMMQRLPLMMALDVDRDGNLSAEEIAKASESLRKLDKNGDGKLTIEELRPEMPGRDGAPASGNPLENFKRMLKARDTNGDGRLSGEEIPEAMAGRLERIDLNGDGAIDEDEIAAMGGRLGERPEKGDGANRKEQRGDGAGVKPKRPGDGQ